MIAGLALKSLRNRRATAALTVASIALSVLLLLGVERIREASRESFAAAVSGTDLVVGARTSPVHLLLASVFHIGNVASNVGWESYRALAQRPEVAWTIPLSLGDSHRGFRVLGTDAGYYEHLRFGRGRRLEFVQGRAPRDEGEAALGAEVAQALRYKAGDAIVIAHGAGEVSFLQHERHPFTITGVLARTGTPADRTVHVSLQGLDAVHDEGAVEEDPIAAALREDAAGQGHPPKAISAFLVGLKSRPAALGFQRSVNEYAGEPLTAILPGVALQEVWEITAAVERTLLGVSALVVAVGLAGMLVALLTSLGERRREMAVLRSVGARPAQIFALLLGEAGLLTVAGIALGVMALYALLLGGQGWIESRLGLVIVVGWPPARELALMGIVALAGLLIGLVPAWRVYRLSLADGMTIRT
ncbi:MAG TPA: ABC transporter permease [Burkholderiales bacterium]|nr:ABC transporter permease [Burkholderiales bacterium]